MADVLGEAKAIKDALLPFGWIYSNGGPYPHAPKLNFYALDGSRLSVQMIPTPKEAFGDD